MSLATIHVELPAYSNSFSIQVPSSSTILEVKQAISRVCPGRPKVEGQKLVCKGRFLANHEKVDEIWQSSERAIVHLAVHPSAWTSPFPTPTIRLPTTSAPSTPAGTQAATPVEHQSTSIHLLAHVAFLHQNAIRALLGQNPQVLAINQESTDLRASSVRYAQTLGWKWPSILDEPYPGATTDGGLRYEQVTICSQPYLRLTNPGAKPTPVQEHAINVLSYTFTLLSTNGNEIVVPQTQPSVGMVPVPLNMPAIPTVNEVLQQLRVEELRIPNQNPNPNPALPEIREIPIRPLLAPVLMLVFRTVLLLYFVAPARKPVFGIILLAWMLYEIWQPIRRRLGDLRRAALVERMRADPADVGRRMQEDVVRAEEFAPDNANARARGGRLENQFSSVLDSFGSMNLRSEEAIVNNNTIDAPEPGWGYKLRTFGILLLTTLHPAVWDRRRTALRRREGVIRAEARMRDTPPRTDPENEEATQSEERAEQAREGLRQAYARRPLWVRRYMERAVETEWVDDE